jgi:hypothetical protein
MRERWLGAASTPWPRGWFAPLVLAGLWILALAAAAPARAQGAVVQGFVTYEKIPATLQGLRFSASERRPAVGVTLEVVVPTTPGANPPFNPVLGRAVSNESGFYQVRLALPDPTVVYVRVRAECDNARVLSPFGGALYTYRLGDFSLDPDQTVTQDLALTDSDRSSGPFNILADIRAANAVVRAAAPETVIPPVTIYWAVNYRNGTFFSPSTRSLYLLGDRGIDSEEFDDSVILHEYGHFLAASFSRDDSMGGTHALGDRLDPCTAFSEGWASFLGQAVLNDPTYIDTYGSNGSVVFTFNLEPNAPSWDKPGYWSEFTVASSLWDLADAAVDPGDELALGFGPIWKALTGGLRSETKVYLIDFCDVLARDNADKPPVLAGLTAILNERRISYTPGAKPSVPNPFPALLPPFQTVAGALDSTVPANRSYRGNQFDAIASYTFTLTSPATVDLLLQITGSRSLATADLDLYLWNATGAYITGSAAANGVGGTERIARLLPAGTYLVQVRSYYWNGVTYSYNTADFQLGLTLR